MKFNKGPTMKGRTLFLENSEALQDREDSAKGNFSWSQTQSEVGERGREGGREREKERERQSANLF